MLDRRPGPEWRRKVTPQEIAEKETPVEIKYGEVSAIGVARPIVFWLQEIAYQLAVMNEREAYLAGEGKR